MKYYGTLSDKERRYMKNRFLVGLDSDDNFYMILLGSTVAISDLPKDHVIHQLIYNGGSALNAIYNGWLSNIEEFTEVYKRIQSWLDSGK